jgi:hypothetical protein
MKFNIQIIAGIGVIVVLFAVLMMLPASNVKNGEDAPNIEEYSEPEPEYSISIATDKKSYHSRDAVQLSINVTVPKAMEDTKVRFFGVKNKYGAYKMKRTDDIDMAKGLNVIETKTNVPSCYGCSGIEPGNFTLWAALIYNGTQIVNSSTGIEILE